MCAVFTFPAFISSQFYLTASWLFPGETAPPYWEELSPISPSWGGHITQAWPIRSFKPFGHCDWFRDEHMAQHRCIGSIMRILLEVLGGRSFLSIGTISHKNVGCLHLLESRRRPPENEASSTRARSKSYEEREVEPDGSVKYPVAPEAAIPELFIYIRWSSPSV